MGAELAPAPAGWRWRGAGAPAWFLLTLLAAAALWSGTIRTATIPYGDATRILPWLSFVQSQADWPTWNPFRNGGYPLFADPEQFWFLIPFVDSTGPYAKLELNLALFVALLLPVLPTWVAARRLGLAPPFAATATVLAVFNESLVLAEQSGRFTQLLVVALFASLLAILLKFERRLSSYAWLAVLIGVWLILLMQYAVIAGLAIWSVFVVDDGRRFGVLKGLIAGTARAIVVGLVGLLVSAVFTLPAIGHFGEAYLPQGLHYEPVVTASWSQAGRFVLPFLPGWPVFLSLLLVPAVIVAMAEGVPERVAWSMRSLWALLGFVALFVLMCIPGIGPFVASVYASVPVLSLVRQLVGIVLVLAALAPLWAMSVFQAADGKRLSGLWWPARIALALYLAAVAVSLVFASPVPSAIWNAVLAVVLSVMAAALVASVVAPALGRRIDVSAGALGAILAGLSVLVVLPVAFEETLPGTRHALHVSGAVEFPEASAIILADKEGYVSTFKPGSPSIWHVHSRSRAGAAFSLFFPRGFAYTLANLSPAFDLTQQRPHWIGRTTCADLDSRALDLLAVRYLICQQSDFATTLPPGLARVVEDSSRKAFTLLRRTASEASTLRVFCRWRAVPDGPPASVRETMLSAFAEGTVVVPAGETALGAGTRDATGGVLDAGCPPSSTSPVSVSMVRDTANEMVLEATSSHAGLLVIPDNFDGGWTASVNGRPVSLERAFLAYRGIPVASGRSEIRLVYRDRLVAWGGLVSGVAVCGLALLAAILLVRGLRRRLPE